MSDGVIYRHTVEAFIQRVLLRRGLLSLEFDRELKAIGVDASRPTELGAEVWIKLLHATARRLSPGKSEADALEDLGREQLRGYVESLVGKALLTVLRLSGPRRALLRTMESYRTADNATRVTSVERGPTQIDLEFSSDFGVPTYVKGLLSETMILLRAKAPTVTFEKTAAGATVFSVSWEA
jgi:uncharacterized protein (TIGR02265 family)